jgi:tetratricopeptide (TPR) repeat protein
MADAPKSQGKSFGFHGREKEFAWLRGMFDAVATKDSDGKYTGPRMAVIVAESGIGKSRLVQELYIRLTNDPSWDPPEVDYWPEAFGDGGVNLRAVPDMKGHVPKGPPRFAWLGARWQSPEERNALERRSVLPELRSSVVVHAEILKSHGSAWADAASRVSESVRKEGVGESIGAAADLVGVPFFGLVSKIAKGAKDLVADRMAGPKSFEKVEQEEIRSEVDEVLDCMRLLLNGKGAVPTVLWLDDAQWIDAETQAFLHKLWKEAERRKWPLLIAVTHWEREWRQLAIAERKGEAGDTLYDFVGKDGVEVQVIDYAETAALRAALAECLPGLTAPQQALLVEKSGGNFLTMMENIGELLRQPANFVDRDIRAALSPAGERKVEKWESLREKRVEQRFGELEPEVQDLLGWSSHLGQRFLRDVVVEFAMEAAKVREAPALIERCVDPYVILGRPGENTREFRDKAFHAVAARHFENYGDEHREALSAVLRRHLVEWVNNSFDAEGNEIWPDEEEGIVAPDRSATSLGEEERRDLLGMAMRELPLPEQPEWENPEHVAALRAVYLLIITDFREKLWDRVAQLCRPLSEVPFESMPAQTISVDNLEWLFDAASTAGAYRAAERIAKAALAVRRRLAEELGTPESRRDVSVSLNNVARIEQARGALDAALAKYGESLGTRRRLSEELGTPESRRDVSVSLINVARIEQVRGDLDASMTKYAESLEIARRLAEELGTPESRRVVSISLDKVAGIEQARGDLDAALAKYAESLGIRRRLAEELGTPESRRGVSVSLDNVARIEQARGDLDAALAKYAESLGIRRRLAEELGTPESLRDVSFSLDNVARIEQVRGDLDAAMTKYAESLGIARRLAEELGTPESLRDVSLSLNYVACIEQAHGALDAAMTKYAESLEIARRLAEELGTPESRCDVSLSLINVARIEQARGDLDAALAKYAESLGIRRRLAEQLGTPESLRDVSISLDYVARIEQARGDLGAAMAKYGERLGICRRLAEELGDLESVNRWIWSAHLTGSRIVELGRHREAREILDDASAAADSLDSSCGDDLNMLDTCAAFHETSAKADAGLGRSDEAAAAFERAAAIRARIEALKDGDAS